MNKIIFEEVESFTEEEMKEMSYDDIDYGYLVSVNGEYLTVNNHDGEPVLLTYAEPSHAIEDILKIFEISAEVEYKFEEIEDGC